MQGCRCGELGVAGRCGELGVLLHLFIKGWALLDSCSSELFTYLCGGENMLCEHRDAT